MSLLSCLAALVLAAGAARAAEMSYVIKVTPALVYLDAGAQTGAGEGDIYAVVRPQEQGHVLVGLLSLIRVMEDISIAEIGYTAEGEKFEILQRAMPLAAWEAMQAQMPQMPESSPMAEEEMEEEGEHGTEEHGREEQAHRRFSLHLMGGLEWTKGVSAPGHEDERLHDRSLGLGLGLELERRMDLGLGCRVVRESLKAEEEEPTQVVVGAEGRLFLRPSDQVGPYLGAGVNLHRLSWEGDSALKWGGQVGGGLQVPLGHWSLTVGGGYQWVAAWDLKNEQLDASAWRSHAGIGMHF